jgi:prefoldin subunit 5
MSETTEIEKKSLEAHVELCAQRYKFLEEKLDSLETKLNTVAATVTTVKDCVQQMSEKNQDRLVNWGIGIIGFLVATVGWLLSQYVFI